MSDVPVPWAAPDLLPPKLNEGTYGYLVDGYRFDCPQESLAKFVVEDDVPIDLVWTPETERVVSAYEVPFLVPHLQERDRQGAYRSMWLWVAVGAVLLAFKFSALQSSNARTQQFAIAMLLMFAVIPVWRARQEVAASDYTREENLLTRIAYRRFAFWNRAQSTPFTSILLVILGVIFFAQCVIGQAPTVKAAGLIKTGFGVTDLYRLLTAELMHGNLMHLALNATALVALGKTVEALGGWRVFLLTFVGSAIGASLCSLALSPQTSIGASGGIMGLIGFLLVFGFKFRAHLPPRFAWMALASILLTALIGATAPRVIDNAAHAGGAIVGMLLGWLLLRNRESRLPLPLSRRMNVLGWLSAVILLAAVVLVAVLFVRR